MPTMYCQNCGFGNKYFSSRPSSCSKCNFEFFKPTESVAKKTQGRVDNKKLEILRERRDSRKGVSSSKVEEESPDTYEDEVFEMENLKHLKKLSASVSARRNSYKSLGSFLDAVKLESNDENL